MSLLCFHCLPLMSVNESPCSPHYFLHCLALLWPSYCSLILSHQSKSTDPPGEDHGDQAILSPWQDWLQRYSPPLSEQKPGDPEHLAMSDPGTHSPHPPRSWHCPRTCSRAPCTGNFILAGSRALFPPIQWCWVCARSCS